VKMGRDEAWIQRQSILIISLLNDAASLI